MATTKFKVEVFGLRGWKTNTVFNDYWLAQEDAKRLESKGQSRIRIVAEKRNPQTDRSQRQIVYGEGTEESQKRKRRTSLGALVFTSGHGDARVKIHKLPFADFLTVVLLRTTIIAVVGLALLFVALHLIDIVMG